MNQVTPVFEGNNLVAPGVEMEARSPEDNGDGISRLRPANRQEYTGSREELITDGYEPCGRCRP